jgi:hypothetical protein
MRQAAAPISRKSGKLPLRLALSDGMLFADRQSKGGFSITRAAERGAGHSIGKDQEDE